MAFVKKREHICRNFKIIKIIVMQKILFIACLLAFSISHAQINTPQPSPLSTVSQKIGLSEATITYSRPAVKDRKIFGDLVPFNKLWRTGANSAPLLKLTDDANIGGSNVPAGEYALLCIPTEKEWTIIINKNSKLSGTYNYKQEEDLIRFTAKSESTTYLTESFTIQFTNVNEGSANIEIAWERTKVTFPISFEFDNKVAKQITEKMAGPTAGELYTAARYYFETNRDLNQALEWINKSLEKQERYWVMTVKAKIQAGLGKYKEAIATAQKAKELAEKDEDSSYAKQNADNIAKWQKLVK